MCSARFALVRSLETMAPVTNKPDEFEARISHGATRAEGAEDIAEMKLNVIFRLSGVGWADCLLTDEISSCTVTASYTSDALRHLVLAATAVLSGFRSMRFSFEEEPGEYRWVVSSPRFNEVEIAILAFPNLWADQPDAEGALRFRTTCRPRVFADAVNRAATGLLAEVGEHGYAEQWPGYSFPSLQLEELQRLLAIDREIV